MPSVYFHQLLFVFAIASPLGFATPTTDGDKLSKSDRNWLEREVSATITAEEIEIFKDLQSKDRKLFKELFWDRRDPNPMTPHNEFMEEYKRRIKAADIALSFFEPETTRSRSG